jgi:hypothetical protein
MKNLIHYIFVACLLIVILDVFNLESKQSQEETKAKLRFAIDEYQFRLNQIIETCEIRTKMKSEEFTNIYIQNVVNKKPSLNEYSNFIRKYCENLNKITLDNFAGEFFYNQNIKVIESNYHTFKNTNYFKDISIEYLK